jgi:cytoskeletal protein CcmA (bactofilin family)
MSKTVQWKRGNTSVNSTYTGAAGEITVDTDIWAMRVHDGSTAGGHPVSAAGAGNLTFTNQTIAGTVANGNIILDPIGTYSAVIVASDLIVSQSGNIFGSFSNSFIQTYSNVNSYSQLVAQNINTGNVASTDYVATADNGTDSTYYIDMGITGSNACVASFFGDTTAKDDGYLYVVGYNAAGPSTGNIGNLILGSTNGSVKTFIGNTANANVITTVSSSGLAVNGNVVITGNLTVANITYLSQEIVSNTEVVAANLTANALTVNNSVTIGTTLGVTGNVIAGALTVNNSVTIGTTLGVTGNVTAGNLTINGNISGNTAGFTIGYRDIPQVVFTSNATLALTDAGKHYFSSNSANVITIPNNTTVSFNIGTAISVIQQGTANLTVTPGSGVTLYLAGNSTSASRNVGNYGMATLVKVNTNTWFINGTGIT